MIGNIIQTQYVNNADYPIASALALILMVALMAAMAVYARVFGTRTLQEHVT
jgi:spermidine/putrescine transport system permease protein